MTAVPANTRTLYYYRLEKGVRVRYKLVLDALNTRIMDVPADVPLSATMYETTEDPALRARQAAHMAPLEQSGTRIVTTATGATHIESASDLDVMIARFYAGSPCWFDGCETLRAAWQEFVQANTEPGHACTDCEKGQLMRQFRPRLEPAIRKLLYT